MSQRRLTNDGAQAAWGQTQVAVRSVGGNTVVVHPPSSDDQPCPIPSIDDLSTLERLVGRGVDGAYWRPENGKFGLLETIHRRGSGTDTYVPVCSRPDAELFRNFADPEGNWVNLNQEYFKLSKATQTMQAVDRMSDHATLSGKDVKSGLRQHLPNMSANDYYLVKYRDYSSFAVDKYNRDARRDGSLFSPKFVEKFFAVRVGHGAGVFVPITEAQMLYGWELIHTRGATGTTSPAGGSLRGGQPVAARNPGVLPYDPLSEDQYRSLLAVVDEETKLARGQHAAPAEAAAPHPWDYSPSAIRYRWNRFCERQYVAVGKVVIKGVIIGLCVYTVYYQVYGHRAQAVEDVRPRRRRARGEASVESVLGEATRLGPRDVFDWLLRPSH